MSLGTLFVNEVPIPIARIYLDGGKIVLASERVYGPLELPANSEVRIHDPNGQLVAVAPWSAGGTIGLKNEDHSLTVFLPIQISEAGWPVPVPH